jgi:hypothetical protein
MKQPIDKGESKIYVRTLVIDLPNDDVFIVFVAGLRINGVRCCREYPRESLVQCYRCESRACIYRIEAVDHCPCRCLRHVDEHWDSVTIDKRRNSIDKRTNNVTMMGCGTIDDEP